jgi:TonB-linked SusC/RagA family outer membrane protein
VLKDADATAIYGSRAANGAILITTKKGKAGRTMVNMNVQNGWGKVTRKMDMLNTEQYLELRREGFKNDNIDLDAPPYNSPLYRNSSLPELYVYGDDRYTDWRKVLIGGTARYTDAQASISGGNEHTQMLLGAGYHKETSVFPLDFSDNKNSLHFAMNHLSTNRRFRAQFTGNYLMDDNKLPNADFTGPAYTLPPNAPELYTEDGAPNWGTVGSGASAVSTFDNPIARSGQDFNYKVDNLLANAVLSYQLFKGLDLRSSFGFNKLETDEFESQPLGFVRPESRPTFQRTAFYGRSLLSSWIVEPQATYQINIGKGKLEALVGGTLQRNNRERTQMRGRGFASDQVMKDIRSAGTVDVQSSIATFYKYNAFFGRLNYNWLDKYIVNLTGRRDGSTRFGSENLFHTFGSVGGAWVFSKEPFMKKGLSVINFGKLRASYGTTGSDQIEDYLFLPTYGAVTSNVPYGGYTGLTPTGLPNAKLQWEETKKMQFGLDLGMFNDRVVINANYYRNRSANQLLPYLLPVITGYTSIAAYNFPATVQNNGWELSVSTNNIRSREFSWSSTVNVTIPKNKLVSFPDIETSAYASSLIVGEPITITKLYKFLGVNATTGLYEVADQHGDPTSNPNLLFDQTAWVNTAPEYYGGLGNNFRYHGFELDVLFQFVKQLGKNNYYGNLPGQYLNQPAWVVDRWRKPGDVAERQRAISGLSFGPSIASGIVNTSDAAYSDASYIRLKNASLSWQLPEHWLKKMHFQQFRLYAQGQNLLTITSYKGLDPENQSLIALPPLRVITLGIQVKL